MADQQSNRPNLSVEALNKEQASLVGNVIAMGAYGIMATIYTQAVQAMLQRRKGSTTPVPWQIIAYSTSIFALASIFVFTNLHSLVLMFVYHREQSGGPLAYSLGEYASPLTTSTNVAAIMIPWFTDGFLLYRCLVIFQLRPTIVAFPIMVYLSVVAMGIVLLLQFSRHEHLWVKRTVDFGVPFFAGSAFVNVLITFMITTKLALHRRKLRRTSGQDSLKLSHVVIILIESSALCATFSTILVIPYGIGHYISNFFVPVTTVVQVLATMLIIWRVAHRRAWQASLSSQVDIVSMDPTSVLFATGPESLGDSITLAQDIENKGHHERNDLSSTSTE